GQANIGLLEQGHHRHQLKRRSRFKQAGGKIELLRKIAVAIPAQVGDRFYFSGRDFHHDDHSVVGVVLNHGLVQRGFRNILEVNIQRRLEIKAVDRLNIVSVEDRLPHTAGDLLIVSIAVLTTELVVEAGLEARTVIVLVDESDGPAPEIGEWHVSQIHLLEDGTAPQPAFPYD